MARSDFTIAAIDAGTTTVRAVIAACRAGEGIRIAGVGTMPSDGVTKSTIIDSAAFVPIARGAMEGAERDARIQVDDVFVTIGGGHVHSTNVAAVLPILDSDETVHEEHIEQLLEKAKGNSAEKGREFLHTIPQEYRLGSHAGVLNPVGLQAARIEAGVHVITADRTILENHCRAFNDAGFRVADVCFSVIAGGACILSEQDKKDGVLLVDIGGGSCSYAVYFNNTVYYSNVFAVGGDHITNDLALGLRLNNTDADDLKCSYARLIRIDSVADDPSCVKVQTAERQTKIFSRADIEMIIDSRIDELLRFVADDIEQRQFRPLLGRGVVFVGGTTYLFRFLERAERIFRIPVRIGIPQVLTPDMPIQEGDLYSDRHEFLRDTTYAASLGLVRYAYRQQMGERRRRRGWLSRLFSSS